MLFDSIKNEILGKFAQQKAKSFQEARHITLRFDRLEREIRDTHDIEGLFAILYRENYTWIWLSPMLEKLLKLNYADMLSLAKAFVCNPYFIIQAFCDECDNRDK